MVATKQWTRLCDTITTNIQKVSTHTRTQHGTLSLKVAIRQIPSANITIHMRRESTHTSTQNETHTLKAAYTNELVIL